ncbi:MAG: ABC transporter ATP-binding protein [Wolinella sp.]
MSLLSAVGVAHAFECELFSDVSLEADNGESIAIIGVSGSGKSTLLHVLSTLLKPNSGSVYLFGSSIYDLSMSDLLRIRREQIGVIFQSHYLFRGFSGIENINIAALLSGREIDFALLESFGIAHIVHQNVGELSGGQQQRLSIARVLTKKPKIIFADEPTGNLDSLTASSVMDAIFDYVEREGALLIFATHDISLARRCTRTYHLENRTLAPWSF